MYDELVKRLKDISNSDNNIKSNYIGFTMLQAADAIEELSKRVNGVTEERDAAMRRLCEWCGVECSMENRRAELCEIAAVGMEFLAEECTSTDWATCQPEPPKEENNETVRGA